MFYAAKVQLFPQTTKFWGWEKVGILNLFRLFLAKVNENVAIGIENL